MEKQARIEASLRERERAVQRFRSEQTKEIDREREQHKREEAVQHFKALMSDMVRCVCNHWLQITAITQTGVKRCVTLCVLRSTAMYFTVVLLYKSHTDHIVFQPIIKAFMNQFNQTPVSCFLCFHSWFTVISSHSHELNQLYESRH